MAEQLKEQRYNLTEKENEQTIAEVKGKLENTKEQEQPKEQVKEEKATALTVLLKAFDYTYAADGIDIAERSSPDYHSDALTRVTSFVGLPNRILDKNKGQSWKNIAYNFIGYQDDVSGTKKAVNAALIAPTVLWNLVNLPFKFLRNVAKLGTEFLPLTIMGENDLAFSKLKFEGSVAQNIEFVLATLACFIIAVMASSVYLTGYAITSPINSAKRAWLGGFGDGGAKGIIFGTLFAALSVAITFTAYAILLPFVIAPALSALVTHGPEIIGTVVEAITPAFTAIGEAILPAVNSMGHMITWGIFNPAVVTELLHPAVIGMGAMIGLFATTAGSVITHFTDKLFNWWHKPVEPVVPPSAPAAKSEQVPAPAATNSNQVVIANLVKNNQDKQAEVTNQVEPTKMTALAPVKQEEKVDAVNAVSNQAASVVQAAEVKTATPVTESKPVEEKAQSTPSLATSNVVLLPAQPVKEQAKVESEKAAELPLAATLK